MTPLPMTESVSADSGISADSRRQQQNRDAQARRRARRRLGLAVRTIRTQREWLDRLEELRYLDPFERTSATAEVAAIEKYLDDHLGGKHDFADTRRD
jgi:hypothetical protein